MVSQSVLLKEISVQVSYGVPATVLDSVDLHVFAESPSVVWFVNHIRPERLPAHRAPSRRLHVVTMSCRSFFDF